MRRFVGGYAEGVDIEEVRDRIGRAIIMLIGRRSLAEGTRLKEGVTAKFITVCELKGCRSVSAAAYERAGVQQAVPGRWGGYAAVHTGTCT